MAVEKQVTDFSVELHHLPRNMRIFSLCLRSLYAENAVGSSSAKAIAINAIRDQTRKDAIVYVNGVLPLSTQVVRSIEEFFGYYEDLTLDEWNNCLPDILEEVTGYQQCCTEVVKMHEEMMAPLKKRQDKAKLLLFELKDLSEALKRNVEQLQTKVVISIRWATILSFVPGVNLIAMPLLRMSASSDMAKAVAESRQFDINDAAILVVSDALIPALSAFIDGLNAVAAFFNIMKEELTLFNTKGKKAVEGSRVHYKTVRKKAVEIKGSCKMFYGMVPGVRTDLQCIKEKPGDRNYVDKWLMVQQKRITKEYSQKITSQLNKMLKM